MKILIVGGTGLISTAISRQLLARRDDLTLYNRGKTPSRVPGSARHILGDRQDFAAFERQMAGAGTFDCVIDMVCFTPEEAASAVRAFKGRTIHTFGWSTAYLDRIRKGKPIVVYGSALWCSCHVDDVGHAFRTTRIASRTLSSVALASGSGWTRYRGTGAMIGNPYSR